MSISNRRGGLLVTRPSRLRYWPFELRLRAVSRGNSENQSFLIPQARVLSRLDDEGTK